MVYTDPQPGRINLLTTQADWAWPAVVEGLFRPAGVNLIAVGGRDQLVDTLRHRPVHAAIIDADQDRVGLSIVRFVRIEFPHLPCLLLASEVDQELLMTALQMEVFSVLTKPPDIVLLRRQLDRLFMRAYNSSLFGGLFCI